MPPARPPPFTAALALWPRPGLQHSAAAFPSGWWRGSMACRYHQVRWYIAEHIGSDSGWLSPACFPSTSHPQSQRLGYSPAHYLSIWRALEALVDEGLIRSLGCSNMTASKLEDLWAEAKHKPANVQVGSSLLLYRRAMRPKIKQRDPLD